MGDCKIQSNSYAYIRSFFTALDKQIDNASVNLAAKDVDGYVRTDVNLTTQNIGGTNVGVLASQPSQSIDENLVSSIRQSQARYSKFNTFNDYYCQLEDLFGMRNAQSSFIHSGENMDDKIRKAELDPNITKKLDAVYAIDKHVKDLNIISDNVQSIRSHVDKEINLCKDKINNLLKDIANYNLQLNHTTDGSSEQFTYLNGRRQSLQELSEIIRIKVTPFGTNQIKVSTESNYTLVQGSVAATLEYTPATVVNPDTTFGALTIEGVGGNYDLSGDLATNARTGKLSALFELRDKVFVGLQQQLDNYAYSLRESFNAVHNLGTSTNPASTILSTAGIPGADAPITNTTQIKGNGILRIGILDPTTSKLTAHTDIDLNGINTVGDLITAINTNLSGANATITADGKLQVTTNSPNGIAIGHVGDVEAKLCAGGTYNVNNAYGFSHFFGFNNLIESQGSLPGVKTPGLASLLKIRDDMISSGGNKLAAGKISSDQTLPSMHGTPAADLGERDISILHTLSQDYQTKKSTFGATETSGQITTTLQTYSANILASHTRIIKDNKEFMKGEKYIYDGLSNTAFQKSGVNPEETIQQIYNFALSKRMGLTVLQILRQMSTELTQLFNR